MLRDISETFAELLFGKAPRCALLRSIAAFVLAFFVIFNPFAAAHWFRIYLYIFCSVMFLQVLCRFKSERVPALVSFAVFVIGMIMLYYGRGDSVSGIGIVFFSAASGVSLFRSCSRRLDRYSKLIRIICGSCAFLVSFIIVMRCSQLGVRYLDQLHSYALALAGCGFANLILLKRGDI